MKDHLVTQYWNALTAKKKAIHNLQVFLNQYKENHNFGENIDFYQIKDHSLFVERLEKGYSVVDKNSAIEVETEEYPYLEVYSLLFNKDVILAQEDDCAPDAYEFFNAKLIEITGYTLKEFLGVAVNTSIHEHEKSYQYRQYLLVYRPDDPYWKLSISFKNYQP